MSIEEQLTELFHDQASHAPSPDMLIDGALGKVRARRRRLATLGGAAAVVALTGVLVVPGLLRSAPTPAAAPATASIAPSGQPTGAFADNLGSCAYAYSPQRIAEAATFAFDGTVLAIGAAQSNESRPSDGAVLNGLVGVTFRVNEWFRGGSRDTVVVDLPTPWSPQTTPSLIHAFDAPKYEVGTRLLVSGAARWGGSDPLASAIAWIGCGGFTQYYSAPTAAAWSAAIHEVDAVK